ncbi:MAG: hypothetical protein KAY24_00280 [Candidatus Eisenbacteria sp.]|nr:hypothetical protein [Candidatus Eisenbacteria bacterium]
MHKIDGWKLCWLVYEDVPTSRKIGYATSAVRDGEGRIKVFTDYDAACEEKHEGRALFRVISSVFHFCHFAKMLKGLSLPADSPWVAMPLKEEGNGKAN